jgi:hypothetical protein
LPIAPIISATCTYGFAAGAATPTAMGSTPMTIQSIWA